MNQQYSKRILVANAGCALFALACGLITGAAPTAIPTEVPFQLPTAILPQPTIAPPTLPPAPVPTDTLAPLPTTGPTAVDENSQTVAEALEYYEKGYLPYPNGELFLLEDYSRTNMSAEIYDFTATGKQAQDFALWAEIELDSTGSPVYPDFTGCGFAYRVQGNDDGYIAFLTNNAVRMGACRKGLGTCQLFGTTHGTGEVYVPNHTRTEFALAVSKDRASVLVDGKLVGQYTLFSGKLTGMGDLYYGTASNLNAGYWTACQISNVRLWESQP